MSGWSHRQDGQERKWTWKVVVGHVAAGATRCPGSLFPRSGYERLPAALNPNSPTRPPTFIHPQASGRQGIYEVNLGVAGCNIKWGGEHGSWARDSGKL